MPRTNIKKKGKNPMNTAFLMGRKSFMDGRFSHPYRKETILAKEWQRGWDRAYFDQQKNPVFKHTEEELDRMYWDKKTEEWKEYYLQKEGGL